LGIARKYRNNNKESIKKSQKEYAISHREDAKKRSREWYKNNKDKAKETYKKYYSREDVRIKIKEYIKRNKEHYNALCRKRNSRIIDMDDKTINQKSLIYLLEHQKNKCNIC